MSSDGSVRVATSDSKAACDGIARFDGRAWVQYLAGHCIVDVDFTSDGRAWVIADRPGDGANTAVYVIAPETVAATE